MLHDLALGIIIALLFVALAVLFCVILIKLYVRKLRNYTLLLYEKDVEFEKVIRATVIETQEVVLDNIARDLHDDAGQQLTYINLQVENLKLDPSNLAERLEPLSESVAQIASSLRGISYTLRNQLLSQPNLVNAIRAEAQRLDKSMGLEVRVAAAESEPDELVDNEKFVIYRIFQEAVHNVLKHAAAHQLVIELRFDPSFEMVIRDDGKGFDLDKMGSATTMGLDNMMQRAELIGYTLDIDSAEGRGTTLSLRKPYGP